MEHHTKVLVTLGQTRPLLAAVCCGGAVCNQNLNCTEMNSVVLPATFLLLNAPEAKENSAKTKV